jgi:2-oxoglutarate ferredoxin oxidoreductase subunit gamma
MGDRMDDGLGPGGPGAGPSGRDAPAGSPDAARREVLISGFGGQGVVTAGRALGLAAVRSSLAATMLVSHGTETRGGYVRSQVVISLAEIDSPVIESPDILCALSQAAWLRFAPMVVDGIALYDPDLVDPDPADPNPAVSGSRAGGAGPPRPGPPRPGPHSPGPRRLALPARALASSVLGTPLAANMVALGAMIRLPALAGLVAPEAAEAAVSELSRRGREVNLAALRLGGETLLRLAEADPDILGP